MTLIEEALKICQEINEHRFSTKYSADVVRLAWLCEQFIRENKKFHEYRQLLMEASPHVPHAADCQGKDYGFDVAYTLGLCSPYCKNCDIRKLLKGLS